MTAWTEAIGWTLLHFVWEGTVIAAVTAVVLHALNGASSQIRYATACAGLLAALAAPLFTVAAVTAPTVSDPVAASSAAVVIPGRAVLANAAAVVAPPARPAVTGGVLAISDGTLGAALSAFVVFWTSGVLLLTTRLALGWWRVRRLQVEALAAPASAWLAAATRLAGSLGLPRAIHVIDSDRVATPTVIGWLQPVVLLPIAAMANLTPAQVHAILAHELAHIRRHDFVVNLLQTIAETLLFYHPGVWWLSSRIRVEREHCCDDIAVQVCGDPVGYAEALTTLASWARLRLADDAGQPTSRLAVAATGGSLLQRVRRLLHVAADSERRRPKAPFVIGATVLLVVVVGLRLIVVAQSMPETGGPGGDRRVGPVEVNRLLGFDLFPGPVQYATDDPRRAPAWEVRVAYADGERALIGFTGRSLIRYAWRLDDLPIVDAPSWMDTKSFSIRAETSSTTPDDQDFRDAIRAALVGQFGVTVQRNARLFPVYGLQVINAGKLGPNVRPSTVDCVEDIRTRPDLLGPNLRGRGQVDVPFCGFDNTIRGPKGYRVTLGEFARALHGFGMGLTDPGTPEPEVVDQTGLTGVYDLELNLGFLPVAAIATAHPNMAVGFGPMVRTFPQAIEEQLGLRLVLSEAPRDVAVVVTPQHVLQHEAVQLERQLAALRQAR